MPGHLVTVGPARNGVAGELGTVVTYHCPGLAALDEQPIGLAGDPDAEVRQSALGTRESSTAIDRPAVIWICGMVIGGRVPRGSHASAPDGAPRRSSR
jgi:hypothetical protein